MLICYMRRRFERSRARRPALNRQRWTGEMSHWLPHTQFIARNPRRSFCQYGSEMFVFFRYILYIFRKFSAGSARSGKRCGRPVLPSRRDSALTLASTGRSVTWPRPPPTSPSPRCVRGCVATDFDRNQVSNFIVDVVRSSSRRGTRFDAETGHPSPPS